jgi:hypothetical protein
LLRLLQSDENTLRRMLANALCAGRVRYKGTIYSGEHEAIIDHICDVFVPTEIPDGTRWDRKYRSK